MPTMIRFRCFVYGRLLIFYPRELRRKFGEEMLEVFAEQLSEVARLRGLWGTLSLWPTALWELLMVAAPLRLRSPALIAAAVSFIATSAMFMAVFSTLDR